MCGIVGYIGKKKALPILIEGLRKLEYRGYDSAGISLLEQSGIVTTKHVGRVDLLEKATEKGHSGAMGGIAHTRWATHGPPNERNAHPHADCDHNIWVCHNGIVENYKALKEMLERLGHQFRSDTDTEIISHLIEESLKKNRSIDDAVAHALKSVEGAFAIAVVWNGDKKKIIAARRSSPLIVGIGKGEYFVASDASAILAHTKNVVYLDDDELAVITPHDYQVKTIDRKLVIKHPQVLDWSPEEAERGGYLHFMLKEIFEAPKTLQNAMRGRVLASAGSARLGGLELVKERCKGIRKIIIVSCGTSYHAGLIGKYMLEEYANIPVETLYASEFRYRTMPIDRRTAILAISQSGETADTLAALHTGKARGALTLGIVNVVGSSIARETDAGVYNHAGPEVSVASTKAFISQLAVLSLFTLWLGKMRRMPKNQGILFARELLRLPMLVEEILKKTDRIKELVRSYAHYENFLYLGRKYNYPTALEGALKIKEIAYIHAEGYPAGEMKHGTIALVSSQFPTLAIAPRDSVYDKMLSNMEEIKARGGPLIAVTTEGNDIRHLTKDVLYIPETLEMFTPILSAVTLQLFAYYTALERGCDVDRPRNLAKSVTVE